MTTEDALGFLSEHQPMPDTAVVSDELLFQLNEVLEHFTSHRDDRCIPLLLNVFGRGDGHGVYQMVEFVLREYPSEAVVPHLRISLMRAKPEALFWLAQIAYDFQAVELIEPLIQIAISDDETLREIAIFALSLYSSSTIVPMLKTARDLPMSTQAEKDLDVLIARLTSSST